MRNKHKIMDAIRREIGMINKVALAKALVAVLILAGLFFLGVMCPKILAVLAIPVLLGALIITLYTAFDDSGYSIW